MGILAGLLDGLPIVTKEADPRVLGPLAEVWDEERAAVARAVSKRQHEFFATRHLARLALDELGIAHAPILNHPDRSPRWPDGVLGSLSHTDTWCGVALTREASGVRGLGIDLERLGCVSPEVEERISTRRELVRSDATRASLRFSAKEAFYKAIFPLVRRFVGFQEVEILLHLERRTFDVEIVGEPLCAELRTVKVSGLFATEAGLCCSAVILE